MKEKIIKYIEDLEQQANESDRFFKERNEALIRIDKAIEYINIFKDDIRGLDEYVLLDILGDKENE